ncbi:hypothetical protein [Methylocystis echinoides]|uniref:hypothetical protein n=1 Tax=Methylocystis echinoides TaxID=29468 RepID=UPI0034176531
MARDMFKSAEAREAFKTACRSAFNANKALLDFLESVMQGESARTLDAIEEAAEEAREAAAAWELFTRLSGAALDEGVRLN